jgi:hypothetical protein
MPLVLRGTKGSALTHTEVDGNLNLLNTELTSSETDLDTLYEKGQFDSENLDHLNQVPLLPPPGGDIGDILVADKDAPHDPTWASPGLKHSGTEWGLAYGSIYSSGTLSFRRFTVGDTGRGDSLIYQSGGLYAINVRGDKTGFTLPARGFYLFTVYAEPGSNTIAAMDGYMHVRVYQSNNSTVRYDNVARAEIFAGGKFGSNCTPCSGYSVRYCYEGDIAQLWGFVNANTGDAKFRGNRIGVHLLEVDKEWI